MVQYMIFGKYVRWFAFLAKGSAVNSSNMVLNYHQLCTLVVPLMHIDDNVSNIGYAFNTALYDTRLLACFINLHRKASC